MCSTQACVAQTYKALWLSNLEIPLANKFYRQHGFRGKAKRHQPCAVVKNSQDKIIGCGYLRDYGTFKLLAGVAVAPDYQGRGVARLLLQLLAEHFDQQTYTFPYQPLLPLYQSLGFKCIEPELETQQSVSSLYQTYLKQGRSIALMVFEPNIEQK